ncbi:WXG100 family type VII secretion target [Rhodococcus sp. X156]|uniref:WXG100 family type VII secretion target n=1 Tax=Rhodococcus sp. X156 TaxID=2499145 RepID=UPI000FD76334|nr:WXG100 family type VII secretion target [Rhodococcus sp. X156]
MSATVATPEELATASSKAQDTAQQVQGELSKLRGTVSGISASWAGDAQRAFGALMERWDVDAKKLNEALLAISDNLAAAGKGFDATQQDHVSSINSVGSSLNL